MRLAVTALVGVSLLCADAAAQFRRGLFAEAHEITLFPIQPPVTLLPAGSVEVTVRNTSTAPARIVERFGDMLKRQLADNDTRLIVTDKNPDVTIVATLTEWSQNRRNSTKYVSETRQVGTREVIDKNGKKKTEPIYEYGRNKPSVVISGAAGVRLEVRRRGSSTPLADESARYTVQEEHLTESGPPSTDAVDDTLIDNVVQRGAGQVTPGRVPVRVYLARSSEVDPFNALAKNRRWNDWLRELQTVKPNRDRKKDAYRLHNLAVAHESLAYESSKPQEALEILTQASHLIGQSMQLNDDEKYIRESAERIARSIASYQRLALLYQQVGATPAPTSSPSPAAARPEKVAPVEKTATSSGPLTNKDVIDLAAAGLDDDNLVATINEAKTVKFDLTPAGLKTLLNGKISNRVINAMRARAKR